MQRCARIDSCGLVPCYHYFRIGGHLACGIFRHRLSAVRDGRPPTFCRLQCNTPPSLRALEGTVPAMASKSFAAGFTAYGWPVTLTDAELLERLLALNHERAASSQE